jgi:hypothetical protein
MPLRPAAEATAGQASRLDSQANRPLLIRSSPALAGWVAFEKEVPMTTLLSKALAVGLCLEWLPAGAQASRTTPDPWPSALMAEAQGCTTDTDSPIRAQMIPSCIALHVLRVPSDDAKFGSFVTRLLPAQSPLNGWAENQWDFSRVAGATGFEPVAFGFGDRARGVHHPPRISPTLIKSNGWYGSRIPRNHLSPT